MTFFLQLPLGMCFDFMSFSGRIVWTLNVCVAMLSVLVVRVGSEMLWPRCKSVSVWARLQAMAVLSPGAQRASSALV